MQQLANEIHWLKMACQSPSGCGVVGQWASCMSTWQAASAVCTNNSSVSLLLPADVGNVKVKFKWHGNSL